MLCAFENTAETDMAYKILIVGDEDMNLNILSYFLSYDLRFNPMGCCVLKMSNGK
jgi:hypothetical protein